MMRWTLAFLTAMLLVPAASAVPPMSPDHLVHEWDGEETIQLSWTAPAETGSAPLDHYLVHIVVNGTALPPEQVEAGTTMHLFGGVQSDTPYLFTVTAVNLNGWESPPSNPVFVQGGDWPRCNTFSWGISPPGATIHPTCLHPLPI